MFSFYEPFYCLFLFSGQSVPQATAGFGNHRRSTRPALLWFYDKARRMLHGWFRQVEPSNRSFPIKGALPKALVREGERPREPKFL
jgi:hypothetical protein